MVLSMPSSTSTTPGIFSMASATRGAHSRQQRGVFREQLDDDRLGRVGEVADHVLQELHELHLERGLPASAILSRTSAITSSELRAAVLLQLDGDVARDWPP